MTSPRRPRPRGADGPLRPIAWDRPTPSGPGSDRVALAEIALVARRTLGQPTPLELVLLASQFVEEASPRPSDVLTGRRRELDALDLLCRDLIDTELPELGALVLAIAAIHPDEEAARRLRDDVPARVRHRGPEWLAWIDRMEIAGVAVNVHPLPDGDNAMISWKWPDRSVGTVSVYIDHNMGTIVKDAHVMPETLDGIMELVAERSGDPDIAFIAAKPADVRTRVTEAIDNHDRLADPIVTDGWPRCRPLVEWLLRQLPDGGTPYGRGHWPQVDRQRLLDHFMSSRHVPRGRSDDDRLIAEILIDFACDHGLGDPLRLSPVSVEIFLVHWLPSDPLGLPPNLVDDVPDVLANFVRYGHERAGIPGALTAETVASIGQWVPQFRHLMGDENAESIDEVESTTFDVIDSMFTDREPAAGRGRGLFEEPEFIDVVDAHWSGVEALMVAQVGGRDAYERLDTEPLQPEPFVYRGTEKDRGATDEALALIDDWAPRLLDTEVQAMARMVLSHLSELAPDVITRSTRSTVAGILWMLMQRVRPAPPGRKLDWAAPTAKALAAEVGVSAPTIGKRAKVVAAALDGADLPWPSHLHSAERQRILMFRRRIEDFRRDNRLA